MPVTPDSILEFAAAMSEGDAEVDWRNATSRAYYAAYHRCRALATTMDPHADLSTGESHRVVHEILLEGAGGFRSLAYQLGALRRIRNVADYEIEGDFDQSSCRNSVATCRKVLERAEAIR